MKLYGAQGVSPQVFIGLRPFPQISALSPADPGQDPVGKALFPAVSPPPHQLEPQRFPGAVRAV